MRARYLLVAALLATAGCGGDDHPEAIEGGIEQHDAITVGTCGSDPQAGCPCGDAGATAACTVTRVSGGYRTCGPGLFTCTDAGTWSECVGDKIWQ